MKFYIIRDGSWYFHILNEGITHSRASKRLFIGNAILNFWISSLNCLFLRTAEENYRLSWLTIKNNFFQHAHAYPKISIRVSIWFHGEICLCSLSQVLCYTPCFQADWTQNLARIDLTSLIEQEATYILNQHTSYKHQMSLHGESAETRAGIIWQ